MMRYACVPRKFVERIEWMWSVIFRSFWDCPLFPDFDKFTYKNMNNFKIVSSVCCAIQSFKARILTLKMPREWQIPKIDVNDDGYQTERSHSVQCSNIFSKIYRLPTGISKLTKKVESTKCTEIDVEFFFRSNRWGRRVWKAMRK